MTRLSSINALIEKNLESGIVNLNEDKAKQIFQIMGMPVVKEENVTTQEQVLDAGQKLGFPLVLKGLGANILHKTEAGLVIVGVDGNDSLKQAAKTIQDRAGKNLDGFLVQPMVQGKREFVAGMFRDDQFGPVIMFGLGGVLTEAIGDIVFKIAPLDPADLEDMLDSLGAQKLLGPFRGEAAVDRESLKSVLKALSDLACACPGIREIDVNPLIVKADGMPVAVDGLMVLEKNIPSGTPLSPPIDLNALRSCFYPESVAFVGASATPGKWGHMLPTNTFARDFKGRVFLINPKGGKIMGRKVYKALSEVPTDVDLAVVTVPAHGVMDLIPEMAPKKVKGMLLITSGFREVGDQGRDLEDRIVAEARKAGILVLGPNTMGVCNPHAEFYSTAANAFPLPGSTALVCQSGNMGTQLLAFAEQQDIGIRAFSGSGNEAMVIIEDYMETFERDELTRTVVLYIESIKQGRRFFKSASRLSQGIISRLKKILPLFWSHDNPVDIVGEGDPGIPRTCMEELLRWDGCDAVIHLGIHGKRILVNAMIESILKADPDANAAEAAQFNQALAQVEEDYTQYVVELTQKYQKPVLGVSLLTDELSRTLYRYDHLEYKGVYFPSPERAVKALSGMVQYQTWLGKRI
ncbi:MAG: acetate--CoA ligase family protein [Desulfobacter sp.]|nr:acetate--CoA ligase family protein [Desulfobacter sp.]